MEHVGASKGRAMPGKVQTHALILPAMTEQVDIEYR